MDARRKENKVRQKERALADPEYAALLRKRQRKYVSSVKYKITHEEYDRLRAIERCEVCDRTAEEVGYKGPSGQKLCIDHDHLTGKVRGVLCKPCNSALGYLGDDVSRIEALARFLKERG